MQTDVDKVAGSLGVVERVANQRRYQAHHLGPAGCQLACSYDQKAQPMESRRIK